jgi:hypothetical protein
MSRRSGRARVVAVAVFIVFAAVLAPVCAALVLSSAATTPGVSVCAAFVSVGILWSASTVFVVGTAVSTLRCTVLGENNALREFPEGGAAVAHLDEDDSK